jgi:phosphatidylethanolamine-binding protein (PEBP) family uncharacterized protein
MRSSSCSALIAGVLLVEICAPAHAFTASFDWGNIPECTSGYPNTVGSPQFMLSDVPHGTAKLAFSLKDLDVAYDHGGGTVAYAGEISVSAGAFDYKSPCPPNGPHTYEWTITAFDADGKRIGEATVRKRYP